MNRRSNAFKSLLFVASCSIFMVSGCASNKEVFSYYGNGQPDASMGEHKDTYLDNSNGDKYLKTFKGWYRVGNINRVDNANHKYKLSTETYSVGRCFDYDDFQTLSMLKWAGFDCYDYACYSFFTYNEKTLEGSEKDYPFSSKDYVSHYQEVRRFADEIGIYCNQIHTPYPIEIDLIMNAQSRSLHVASILGAEVAAIHPMVDKSEQENVNAIRKLIPDAKKYNVKIALENMSKYTGEWFKENGVWIYRPFAICTGALPSSLLAMVEALDSEYVGAIIDIGHAFLYHEFTTIPSYFHTLKKHVLGVHLQDGDNQHDAHLAPFLGDINMKEVANALLDTGYDKALTLEAMNSVRKESLETNLLLINNSISAFRDLMENSK